MLKKTINNKAINQVIWADEPPDNLIAFSTTRDLLSDGEDKQTLFGNFNLGLHVGDDPVQVKANRQQLLKLLPEKSKIQWLEQVHGSEVVEINEVNDEPFIADAAITRQPNIALAVMTADCLPILITSTEQPEIAVIHGGWRSLAGSIIQNTVLKMRSQPQSLKVWLGPCIGQQAFEVGEEVQQIFAQQSKVFQSAFQKTHHHKYLADLHLIATLIFNSLGVKQITALSDCTYTQHQRYYSYRQNQMTGRFASVICLR